MTMMSASTTTRPFFQAIALLAAVAGIVASLLVVLKETSPDSQWQQPNNLRNDRRQLLGFHDPKTVELRPPGPPLVAHSSDAIAPGPRLITAAPSELHKFPYYTSTDPEKCVKAQDIIDISEFIKDLYVNHRIRTFPRNGFLLGIVRHGGFLPIEGVDVDMGVVYEDLIGLGADDFKIGGETRKRVIGKVGDFNVRLDPTEKFWVNWKGIEPLSQQRYPYFGAMISRGGYRLHAYAAYPYRETKRYFYPRLDKAGFNHDVHVKDALRYNTEGADYRLVDTDEMINESNFKDGAQVATIFDTTFDCFMETQFYFTTIIVPCDYDKILTAQFGDNWRYVERRGGHGGPRHEAKAVSEEENEQIMKGGPRPVCTA